MYEWCSERQKKAKSIQADAHCQIIFAPFRKFLKGGACSSQKCFFFLILNEYGITGGRKFPKLNYWNSQNFSDNNTQSLSTIQSLLKFDKFLSIKLCILIAVVQSKWLLSSSLLAWDFAPSGVDIENQYNKTVYSNWIDNFFADR